MFHKKHRSYEFVSCSELNTVSLDTLILLFNSKENRKPRTILGGRSSVLHTTIEDVGPVIIKHYTRGGFVSFFNRQRYFFAKKRRGQIEFEFMVHAKKAGVNVPKPFAYTSYGSWFYKAWLITKKIENAQNFVEICLNDLKKAITFLPEISENINKLIAASIHHIDLHPGNIIIDSSSRVYIIDFDKACYFTGKRKKLKKKYRQRWQRALEKYYFSDELSNLLLE